MDGELEKVDLTGKHGPKEFTGLAMQYIDQAAQQNKPFALFLSWNPPHDPWTQQNVPKENYENFKNVEFGLPENFKSQTDAYMDRYPGQYFDGKEWKGSFLKSGLQECLRCYYAFQHIAYKM